MKKTEKIDPDLIADDVDSASFLIDRLNEFLAGMTTSTDLLLDVDTVDAVKQAFLSLEQIWSADPDSSPKKIKDLDPAEKFAVKFFYPLLDSDDLRKELESGDPQFGPFDQSLIPPTVFSSQRTQLSLLITYSQFFVQLEAILRDRGFPEDQIRLVLGAVRGIVALCSFPLWLVYYYFHGYAAYDRVVPRLLESLSVAQSVLRDVDSSVVRSVPSWQVGDLEQVLSLLRTSLQTALTQKIKTYVKAFNEHAKAVRDRRTRPSEEELDTEIKSLQFWRHESGGNVSISLARTAPDPNADKKLSYLGDFFFADGEKVQERSFLALPESWEALVRAARFVSQAGFWLYVNAANNPYGGKHPPHKTHQNGECFDLGWTFLSTIPKIDDNCVLGDPVLEINPRKDPDHRERREDLAQMKITVPGDGDRIFWDPAKHKTYALVPTSPGPITHTGIQKLAVLVVLQAIALSGFKRYLYADPRNMYAAASDLELAMRYLAGQLRKVDPKLNPWLEGPGNKAAIRVVEDADHYNHIHGEVFARDVADSGPLLEEKCLTPLLTFLYQLALERDNNNEFLTEMFQPTGHNNGRNESKDRIEKFKLAWQQRSNCGMPSLLPVWLSKERRKQFWGQPSKPKTFFVPDCSS